MGSNLLMYHLSTQKSSTQNLNQFGAMEATFLKSFCLLMSVAMILGAPQDGPNHGLGACPNGPCAALWGPCVEDSDCMEEGNVCVDDMETCRNMFAPCCQMGEGSGEPIVEEVEE